MVNRDTTDSFTKAREIASTSGIMRELREGNSPEEVSRFENLEELLNGIKVFTEAAETNGESSNLEAYLANVSLLTASRADTPANFRKTSSTASATCCAPSCA